MTPLASTPYPFDSDFYAALSVRRADFTLAWSHVMPKRSGYGWRVNAGQTCRLVMVEGGQVADLCIYSADDPSEHYSAGAQFYIEGAHVTKTTRIWGTPPRSRPLATVIGDTVRVRPHTDGRGIGQPERQHHKCYGAHCNPHHWMLYAGIHPPTCYDNLREGLTMLGMDQTHIHDNLNLFGRFAMDPESGLHVPEPTQAEVGDYIEFYAEIDLLMANSACPYGFQAQAPDEWKDGLPEARPIGIEVYDTGITPLNWPY